jgi:hypothetical protein
MSNKGKGSAWERTVCAKLSLWWSEGDRDDLFWRTGGSGGRANVRGQRGRRTHGQHGDICATHPSAEPLIDLLTVELKRGYSKHTVADLLDKSPKAAIQTFEEWLDQIESSHTQAGSFAWLLIQRRDKRQPLVFFPDSLLEQLNSFDCFDTRPSPFLTLTARIRRPTGYIIQTIHGTSLQNWFDYVTPACIRHLARTC